MSDKSGVYFKFFPHLHKNGKKIIWKNICFHLCLWFKIDQKPTINVFFGGKMWHFEIKIFEHALFQTQMDLM